jgi:hypothetical protein
MLTEYSYNDAGKVVEEFSVRCCPFCRSKAFTIEEEARIMDIKFPKNEAEFAELAKLGYEPVNVCEGACMGLLKKRSEVTP